MHLILFLVIGALAGWIGSSLMKGGGFGLVGNLVVGVIGAFVGGLVFDLLGISAGGMVGTLVMAVVGAMVFLFVVRLIKSA